MPYEYPEAQKIESVKILRWIFDRAVFKREATCVYDVGDLLIERKVKYQTPEHLLNDASQRLRTLFKSNYIMKVSPGFEDDRVKAAACGHRIDKRFGDRKAKRGGRRPSIYALTDQGYRYGRTLCDLYFDPDGKEIERDAFLREKKKTPAWIVVTDTAFRAGVLAESEAAARAAFKDAVAEIKELKREEIDEVESFEKEGTADA